MIAVIMAGGNGTRMAPAFAFPSKVLISLHDAPLIQHNIDLISPYVTMVHIVTGKAGKMIEEYSHPASAPLLLTDKGTAETPLDALRHIPAGDIILLNGDEYLKDPHMEEFIHAVQKEKPYAMIGYTHDTPEEISKCYSIEHTANKVTHLTEKPQEAPNDLRGTGYIYLSKNAMKCLRTLPRDKTCIVDLLNHIISKGHKVSCHEVADKAYNINTVEDLRRLYRENDEDEEV